MPMPSEEFSNYCLRVQLLGVDTECFWVIRVPVWFTLAELHHCFQVILGWPEGSEYDFNFEDADYRVSRNKDNDTRRTFLSDAFLEVESAFYHVHKGGRWDFLVRRTFICSDVSSSISLLHAEDFPPPADCPDVSTYMQLYKDGDLFRKPPAEELERRLQFLERNSTNWIGSYCSKGMSLSQAVIATLLERENRPAFPEEIESRLYWSDYEKTITPSAIKRVAKKLPLKVGEDGRVSLIQESQEYDKALKKLSSFQDPSGAVKLLVKRFPSRATQQHGYDSDVILVIDSQNELVQSVEFCHEFDGVEPFLDVISAARVKVPQAHAVVIDEDELDLELEDYLDIPVELRYSLEEMVEPFLALEEHNITEDDFVYPSGLGKKDLSAFCEAAQRYFLVAPWSFVSDSEVFCLEGLTSDPLFAVVLGYAHQVYGVSLFESFGQLLKFLRGERPCLPYCFMDFPDLLDSKQLRQTLDQKNISYLSRDTCPFVYGPHKPATPDQFKLMTGVLNLLAERVSPVGGPQKGSTLETDSKGQKVRVTWPVDLSQAI